MAVLFLTWKGIMVDVFVFAAHCHDVARALANPKVVTKGKDPRTGKPVLVDDYYKVKLCNVPPLHPSPTPGPPRQLPKSGKEAETSVSWNQEPHPDRHP
eukprot:6471870-Amphidinium_carterae.1